MQIAVPKETHPGEFRLPAVPKTVEKMVKMGAQVAVEAGLGEILHIPDAAYKEAGATLVAARKELLASADVVLRLRKPPLEEVEVLKKGAIQISFLDPFNEAEMVQSLARAGVSAISMEMLPRTTLAQKMDALSSQASLAGYVAVLMAARKIKKIFPMMTTPAGTISPAHVFIIGVGVAGLQAIATAKRLGAVVQAFDTRPVVEEQVKSLGARFVKIDLGETGQTKDGYAKALTPEQLAMQKEGMAKVIKGSDIVITTAQLFGRKAPRIVDAPMVAAMKPGSVCVDLAVDSGGNIEGSQPDQEVDAGGVTLMGLSNFPGEVARDASEMYAANLYNLLSHFWDKEANEFKLDLEDEIIQGCLITHNNEIVNATIKEHLKS